MMQLPIEVRRKGYGVKSSSSKHTKTNRKN